MSGISRRDFLKGTAATGAALSSFAIGAGNQVLGANNRLNVAVAGINGRGRGHIKAFANMENVRVTHLVDPDSRLFDSRKKIVEDIDGNSPVRTGLQLVARASPHAGISRQPRALQLALVLGHGQRGHREPGSA